MCGASSHVSFTPSLFSLRTTLRPYFDSPEILFPFVTILSHSRRYHGPMILRPWIITRLYLGREE